MPLRILIYTGHGPIVGGDAKAILELVSELDLTRFEVRLFTDDNPAFDARAKQWLKPGIAFRKLPTYPPSAGDPSTFESRGRWQRVVSYLARVATGQWFLGMLRNYRIFSRLFREEGPFDVFFFNNGGYPGKEAGLVALFAARRAGIHARIMWLHNLPRARRRFRPVDRVWDALLARSCTHVVNASEALLLALSELRGFPRERMSVVYCGVRDAIEGEAASAPFERREGVKYLLLAGNIIPGKGHEVLIRALGRLKNDQPKVELLVVGEGSAAEVSRLKALAEEQGLAERVRFLGYRDDMDAILGQVDLSVVPSTFAEATPYTIKEAMRAGVPVITTTSGGCAEAVEDGISGLVVPPGDVEALAAAIERVLKDPAWAKGVGERGRRRFLERFEMRAAVRAQERLLEAQARG